MRNVKACTTVGKLEDFVTRFGAPKRPITDRGTSFQHLQPDGQVERLNQTVLLALQANLPEVDGRKWDKDIVLLERDPNTSVCKTTSLTPFEMLYGYIPRFQEGGMLHLTIESEGYKISKDIQNKIRNKIEIEQLKMKERYDRSRAKNVTFKLGDIVFVKCMPPSTSDSTKLLPHYKDPMVITKILPSDTYAVQRLGGKVSHESTAHISQLKIWRSGDYDLSDHENNDETSSDSDVEIAIEDNSVQHHPENQNLQGHNTNSTKQISQKDSQKNSSTTG